MVREIGWWERWVGEKDGLVRIGYHDPVLVFTSEGWQVILWSFWHGFIVKEGRIFLVVAIELSIIVFGILGVMNIYRQILSFLKGGEKTCRCKI